MYDCLSHTRHNKKNKIIKFVSKLTKKADFVNKKDINKQKM